MLDGCIAGSIVALMLDGCIAGSIVSLPVRWIPEPPLAGPGLRCYQCRGAQRAADTCRPTVVLETSTSAGSMLTVTSLARAGGAAAGAAHVRWYRPRCRTPARWRDAVAQRYKIRLFAGGCAYVRLYSWMAHMFPSGSSKKQ